MQRRANTVSGASHWKSECPTFSVIIPTHNRSRQLRQCLSALTKLNYPADCYEVIVVDDGSPQRLDAVVGAFQGRMGLQLIRQANQGPGAARNTGAATAANDFLAFTDDDCEPDPNWLRDLAVQLREHPDRMIGGKTVNGLAENPCAAASQLIVDIVYDYYNSDPDNARFLASNNMAVPAKLFRALGGFDPGFQIASEDRDLCDRWLHAGHGITYTPGAVVRHAHELTVRDFCRQHFSYGRGAKHYHNARTTRNSGRMRDDMGFHARLMQLLRKHLRKVPAGRALQVAALLATWQVSNAAGFFYEQVRHLKVPSAPSPAKRPAMWKSGWPNL